MAGAAFVLQHKIDIDQIMLAESWTLLRRLVSSSTNTPFWTNDILAAARHLYERAGFRLAKEERYLSTGNLPNRDCLILGPECQSQSGRLHLGLSDQLFFAPASGSTTSTMPPLRLRKANASAI
jgi:hypothetical protein